MDAHALDRDDELRTADQVDGAWLTRVLHAAGIGTGRRITGVQGVTIGTGQVGENVRFLLEWDATGDGTGRADDILPGSVVGKFPSGDELSRATAVQIGTYLHEVGFYRDLQPRVDVSTPGVHHVGWDPGTHDFVIVMEDVTPAVVGDQLQGCTVDTATSVIDEGVGLHAPTWGRVEELRDHDWLQFPDPEHTATMTVFLDMFVAGFVDRYRGRLADEVLDLAPSVAAAHPALSAAVADWGDRHGWCVVHGDLRLDNVLFGGGGATDARVTIVDWQTVSVGIGPADVAYFCGAGLLPDDRRRHERAIVDRYARALRRRHVDLSDDDAWDGYVLGSAGGFLMAVLASQIVGRTERGDEMFAVMAERHADQIEHVGLLDRIGPP